MNITLYLPYFDYNTSAVNLDNYYKDENAYIEAMRKEYESSKDEVFEAMTSNFGGLTVKDDKAIGLFQASNVEDNSKDNIKYSTCQCKFIGENGHEENADTMINHMVSQDLFIVEAILDYNTIGEEFEGELNDWNSVTDKINSYANKAGEDWILQNAPKKNIKISFLNKANKQVNMELKNAQILERSSIDKLVLLVEKVELVD